MIARSFPLVLFLIALILPRMAMAQEQTKGDLIPPQPSGPCWEITSPAQQVTPQSLVLLNRCSGQTWILEKIFFVDKQDHQTGEFTYRWAPIAVDPDEAKMTMHSPLSPH